MENRVFSDADGKFGEFTMAAKVALDVPTKEGPNSSLPESARSLRSNRRKLFSTGKQKSDKKMFVGNRSPQPLFFGKSPT